MRAFITGVTGFAGSHLAEILLASGDEVLGSSHFGKWGFGVPAAVRQAVKLLSWDLSEGADDTVCRTVREFQPDAIYHLAAISIPSACGGDEPTPEALAINVQGTEGVIELCRTLGYRPRVLLVSSCYVYAPVSPASPFVTENSRVDPQRAYGKTKLMSEVLFQRAIYDGHLDGMVARSFQHAGRRQSPRMILPEWIRQFTISADEPIRVVCLDTHLDLTDVRDICQAYRRLVVDGKAGTVYNVGSGVDRRSGDLLEIIQQVASTRREVIEMEPGFRQHPIADISRLVEHTGWKSLVPLEQTVRDTFEYWRARLSYEQGMDS